MNRNSLSESSVVKTNESGPKSRGIGLHVSISGHLTDSVQRAQEVGCVGVFQIFTCSPRRWEAAVLKEEEISSFRNLVAKTNYKVFCHMPYLPNLCSPDVNFHKKSSEVLTREIQRCDKLGIENLVVHFGSHLGTSVSEGHHRLIAACQRSLEVTQGTSVKILLENSAGVKNSVGSNFHDIAKVLDSIGDKGRLGVCFDTCHAFASGYDLRTDAAVDKTLDEFDDAIGLENLLLIHLNDSKGGLGDASDRHEDIGKGKIGKKGLGALLGNKRILQAPVVLETPIKKEGDDRRNLKTAKSLMPDYLR